MLSLGSPIFSSRSRAREDISDDILSIHDYIYTLIGPHNRDNTSNWKFFRIKLMMNHYTFGQLFQEKISVQSKNPSENN